MCLYFHALNKLAIRDKFLILVIDNLLDELQGTHFPIKIDLHLRYHQNRMKEVDIPKISFHSHEGHNYEY